MFCTSCGFRITVNANIRANFCANCGEAITAQTDEPQPKVHHPWMTAQPSRQEHSRQEVVQPEPQTQVQVKPQSQGELEGVINRLKAFVGGIGEWSTKKKILWGVVAGFLLLVCAAALAGEPVEETVRDSPSGGGSDSKQKQQQDNKLVNEFGCQWIMDTYRPFADVGRETAVLNLSTEMTLKRDDLSFIGTGDAAEALRECEAVGWR